MNLPNDKWVQAVVDKIGPHRYIWTGRSPDTCAVTKGASVWCGLPESHPVHISFDQIDEEVHRLLAEGQSEHRKALDELAISATWDRATKALYNDPVAAAKAHLAAKVIEHYRAERLTHDEASMIKAAVGLALTLTEADITGRT